MAKRRKEPAGATAGPVHALRYGRVSSERQKRHGLSLGDQQQATLDYCARQGWVVGDWRHDAETGRKVTREAYQDTLTQARALRRDGHAVALVLPRIDRFGRNAAESLARRDEMERLGVEVHSVHEGGRLTAVHWGILAVLAEQESERIGERLAGTVESVVANGWHWPGRIPWGFIYRTATDAERAAGAPKRVLADDPETAGYVVEAFTRVADGESVRSVARWVAGLPAPARGGRVLSHGTLATLLRSRVYVGESVDGRAGRWRAVVGRDVWATVQAYLAHGGSRLSRAASATYLLTGLLRCEHCGSAMYANRRPGGRTTRYVCRSAGRGARYDGPACVASGSAPVLEAATLAVVEPVILGAPAVLRRELADAARTIDTATVDDGPALRLGQLERQRATAEGEIAGLARALARGDLDATAYNLAVAGARADYDGAVAEMDRVRALPVGDGAPDLETLVTDAERWAHVWRGSDTASRRALLAEYVWAVRPIRDGDTGRVVDVEVTWRPAGDVVRELLRAGQAEPVDLSE